VYRPAQKPSFNLPFGVGAAGHYQNASGIQSGICMTSFVQVFWCAAGRGIVVINGRERFLCSGQIALYFPKMEHRYYSNESWDIYWWTMDGALAPVITAAFGLNADVYDAGPPPLILFRQLAGALRNPSPVGELHTVNLAFQLLTKATIACSQIRQRADSDIGGVVDYINTNWNRPTLNIKSLADAMGLNRSSLSHRFKIILGISPSEYIARLRIQNAISMLTGTKKSVTDIAAACGYLDQHYFTRLLKKRLGSSPLCLRKKSSAGISNLF
jgi:AraC-like DNA-binding protein